MGFPNEWANMLSDKAKAKILMIEHEIAVAENAGSVIYPARHDRYKALKIVEPRYIKAVFIGQDPYHGPQQAMGLSFSVPRNVKIPSSLRNIFKELHSDCGVEIPAHGDLTRWAEQGCLLLNTSLTVLAGKPGSHKWLGWFDVTAEIVQQLSNQYPKIVFILWGRHAQELKDYINPASLIIESSHPSSMGGACNKGFFGSKPFSQINARLKAIGMTPIDWGLV